MRRKSGRKPLYLVAALLGVFLGALDTSPSLATTRTASTQAELTTALTASSNGDEIQLTSNIVLTSTITITKGITLDGQGFTLSVSRPGLTSAGIFDTGASTFAAMVINASGLSVTIHDLIVKGGYSSTAGNGISITAGNVLIDQVVITQSRGSSGGGGLRISSGATVTMQDSVVYRNSARYGGGLLNGGRLILLRTTLSENRSESTNGGGGAVENQSGGVLYVINSTFANNQSTEIGGAINNYRGTLYVASSTFTGNVAYGSTSFGGGAIGQNGGSVTVVSSLFAFNYQISSGSVTNPTGFELDDLDPYSGTPVVRYSVVHDSTRSFVDNQNSEYTGLVDGSDDTLFAGGVTAKLTDGTGAEIGSASIFRPFLVQDGSLRSSPHATGSFATNAGTSIRFESAGATQSLAYFDRLAGTPAWVNVTGTPSSGSEITTDQVGNTRAATPWAGAIEETAVNLVSLIVRTSSNGSVSGGSLFGDTYVSGSTVRLTALANSGYKFSKWIDGSGADVSTSNPYVFTISSNTTLQPDFSSVGASEYELAYADNGATGGTPPTAQVATSSVTVADNGSLVKSGHEFADWNTQPNGSGTTYEPGDTYNSGQNVVLYAMWDRSATTTTTTTTTTVAGTPANSGDSVSTTVVSAPSALTTIPSAAPQIARRTINQLPSSGIYLSGRLEVGNLIRIRAINLSPNVVYDFFIASKPELIGSVTANSRGVAVFEYSLKARHAGNHTIAVVQRNSTIGARMPIFVQSPSLPSTGSDDLTSSAIAMIVLGFCILFVGARSHSRRSRVSRTISNAS